MRLCRRLILCLFLVSIFIITPPVISANKVVDARIASSYGKLPLSFVENRGQLDKRARFVISGPRASAFFRNDGVTFDLWDASKVKPFDRRDILKKGRPEAPSKSEKRKHAVLKLTFKGANPKCRVEGMDTLPGKVNFMKGNDRSKWHIDVPAYKGVIYRNVWQGIDVMYRGDRRQLKYDIRVNPGADLTKVRLQYDGAQKMWLDKKGDLHIKTAVTEFIERVPGIYQERTGKRISIRGGYKLLDGTTLGFSVKHTDPSLPLIIDPAGDVLYSTFLGGGGDDLARGIAVDSSGCAYVTGMTNSTSFPATVGTFQSSFGGDGAVFVAKLNPAGTALTYSTFFGPASSGTFIGAMGIAVDSSGCAYIAGYIYTSDFPTTPGAFDTSYNGSIDAYAAKFDQFGSTLLYSTFLGGSLDDNAQSIAVDSSGCAYVAGMTSSTNYPTTAGSFHTAFGGAYDDGFVTKLNPSGSALLYSTFIGGNARDQCHAIAVDSSGCAYAAGLTWGGNFPTTPGAFQTSLADTSGSADGFVTKFNDLGSALVYSTFLGGSYHDYIQAIALDPSGCAYVGGGTTSYDDFPTTPGAFQTTFGGAYDDGFVTKLSSSGSALVYSTYLGGSGQDVVHAIAVDPQGRAYVGGDTFSTDFPTTAGAFQTSFGGAYDAFVTELSPAGNALLYSTYLGGIHEDIVNGVAVFAGAVNAGGAVPAALCIAGDTASADFPTTAGAFDTIYNGPPFDAFATKLTRGVFKSDLIIKTGPEVSYSGTGVFSTNGSNQIESQSASANQTVTYAFRIMNAGLITDSFKIRGFAGGNGWTVKYYDLATNADVTSLVTGAGWASGDIAVGDTGGGVYVAVTPDSTVSLGDVNTLIVKAISDSDFSKMDAARAVTTCVASYKPDLLIKAGTETSYTGTAIFNTDGTDQTKSQNAAPGQKVTYTFRVKNAGDANDSFNITGPTGGNGWSVRYYDLNTSAELTSQVTGAGCPSGILVPGANKGIFVKIMPDATVPVGSVNTLLITATSDADNTKTDVVKTVTNFTGSYKTDMILKAGSETSYTGTGIFNTDGTSQTKSLNVCAGQKVAYTFRAKNAGNANDSFRITGTAGGSGWSVKYYDIATNAEVTSQVTGSGWVSGTVAPNGYPGVYANVKPDASVPLGSTITLTITGSSVSDNTKIDVVKAVTTCVASYQPDMLIKNSADASYIGTDIFNADGTNQSKSQSASAGVKVTYSFRVKNAGYLSDSFNITGTAGGSGWSVKYYDLASVEITSQVTGGGWLSGTLASGTDRGFFVKVSPDGTVALGAVKMLLITATSVGSSTKQDVVKAVTTVP